MEGIPTEALMIPIVGIIAGVIMIIAVVGTVFWFKAREKELQVHQHMRTLEMEHQRRMKELELETEKVKARQSSERVQA